jgi:hypothetical protein
MSGLGKNPNNLKFVKIKDGKFYLSTDKENTEPYDDLSGHITDFRFKDEEFNNTKIRKLYVYIKSVDGTYAFSVAIDSSYASTLISFLKNADLTQEVTLIPSLKLTKNDKGEDVKKYTIFVKQGGDALKSFYSRESGNTLPEFKKLKVSGKFVWDKTEFLEGLEKVVTEDLIPAVSGNKNTPVGSKALPEQVETEDVDETINELPWK